MNLHKFQNLWCAVGRFGNRSPRTFMPGSYNFSYLKPPNKVFRSAPTIVEGYIARLDRVQRDYETALHFFESSTNTFHFECGMMTLTLFDVAALTGLPPTGDTYDPTKAGSKIELKINHKSYSKFIEEQNQLVGEMFIPMAIQLHEGQQFGFGKLILGCLYENMRHVCENIKKTEMDMFLPELHNEEVARRQIEGVRLARLIPRSRGLTHEQLFMHYFNAFLGLKEFKERFAPFATRKIGPQWFIHPFPPLPESEEYQNSVWQFGLTQILPKTIYLSERDICLGYYGMTEPQFYALLKKFEGVKYGLTPFQFEPSYFHTRDFYRWWDLHYHNYLIDARSKSKAGSNSSAKPPFPLVKTEPGTTTRKRAAMAEAGGPSKKAKPIETIFIDDDDVVEVEQISSMQATEVNIEASQLALEHRSKRKHEQPATIMEETQAIPSEKEEKKRKKKKKDKGSEDKEDPSKYVASAEKKRKKKKKHNKSHSQPEPSTTTTSKPAVKVVDEPANEKPGNNPDSTQVIAHTPDNPQNTNLGQDDTSPAVLVPKTSLDSIVKTIVSELNQQLEHSREEEVSPIVKAVEDTGVPTQVIVSTPNETSPPKAFVEVDTSILAGSSNDKEVKDSEALAQECWSKP
ncbi:hypothetical protein TSUD_370970 [Trifolium subterraneum]|uniref:Aminotransferase-like plant mobile domain-containing protein n=1 Tax=Trifolium subterraneum TaxID=3900 RepID=A0A2Z6NBR5_TRISU|nr:hypothetical protein TSUD_370970 [Trifolium subterraneum]